MHYPPSSVRKVLKTLLKDLGLTRRLFHQPDNSLLRQLKRRKSWKPSLEQMNGLVLDDFSMKYPNKGQFGTKFRLKACLQRCREKGNPSYRPGDPLREITGGGFCEREPFPGGLRPL